jgi:CBS domain containing-hemolysin-like protein
MDWLQRLPAVDEVLDLNGWRITVVAVRSHRIETLWLTRQDAGASDPA